MRFTKNTVIAAICLIMATKAWSTDKAGTSAAQFLKIGVGARATAMAGAFGAVADDPSTLYWNPAGITQASKISFFGMHTDWFADIDYQFAALIMPAGPNAIGLSLTLVSMNEMEMTTIAEPKGTGVFFDATDIAVGASYARQLTDRFSFGLTGKYIQQNIYNESASTFAFDIGTLLKTPFRGLRIGMNFSNFGGKMKLDGRDLIRSFDASPNNSRTPGVESRLSTEPWELPVNFRVGIALDLVGPEDSFIASSTSRVTFAADGNHPNDGEEVGNFGVEYALHGMLFIRGGYRFNYDEEDLTFGAGLRLPAGDTDLNFDYAAVDMGAFGMINYFSFSLGF